MVPWGAKDQTRQQSKVPQVSQLLKISSHSIWITCVYKSISLFYAWSKLDRFFTSVYLCQYACIYVSSISPNRASEHLKILIVFTPTPKNKAISNNWFLFLITKVTIISHNPYYPWSVGSEGGAADAGAGDVAGVGAGSAWLSSRSLAAYRTEK